MTGDGRKRGEHAESGIQEGLTQKIARLCTIMHDWTRLGSLRATGRTHLSITTIGGNEPLSLALSPLRGARELENCVGMVASGALFAGGGKENLSGGAGEDLADDEIADAAAGQGLA